MTTNASVVGTMRWVSEDAGSSAERLPDAAEEDLGSVRWGEARLVLTRLGALSAVQRGVTGVVVGGFLILWPGIALSVAVAFIGATLAVLGLLATVRAIRRRRSIEIGRGVLDVGVGVGLVVVSSLAGSLIATALAIGLILRGLLDAAVAVRRARAGQAWAWFGLKSLTQIVTGGAVAVIGDGVVVLILLLVGVIWLIGGILGILAVVGGQRAGNQGIGTALQASESDSTQQQVVSWLQSQDVGPEARLEIVTRLIFEGDDLGRRIARYVSLMAFATAIAALGIQTDSTAVVIGAMLVAPLMTPIMATSLSLVLGLPKRAVRSLGLVGAGVVIAVGFSFLIARYAPGVVEIGANSQIAARTAPTLLDLLIALAAGCAGGYAVCRPDVSDSLPGVAIAVALVPPLAVVGITLAASEVVLASGAFLLFLTNLVGIIVASGLMFATTGVAPWTQLSQNVDQLRRTAMTVLVALVLVAIPLAIIGRQILADATNQNLASSATQEWIDELLGEADDDASSQIGDGLSKLQVVQVSLDGDVVEVVLIGDQEVEDASDLADRLSDALDGPVMLELRIIPETRISVGSP